MSEGMGSDGMVREGYKEAQLGPKRVQLPVEWIVTPLGEVAEISMGSSPPSEHYNESGEGLPFFQGNADFGLKEPTPSTWCSSPQKVAQEGDLLISVRAPVGDLNIAGTECCIGRGVAAITGDSVDNGFLYYLLYIEQDRLGSYAQGSTFDSVNQSVLNGFPIPKPPLPEQRRIAAILSTVDEEIQQTDEIIDAANELKQGLAQKLVLGHGLSNDLQETSLGPKTVEIPSDWRVSTFAEVATIEKGNTPKTSNDDYYGGDIVWITPDDLSSLYERGGKYISDSDRKLTEAGLNSTSVDIVEPNSVMFTSRSYGIGKTAICTVPAATNQGIIAFNCNQDMNEEYLYYYLNWIMDYIISLSGVSTFPEVSQSDIKSINVPVPSKEDQQRVANVLKRADEKIAREKQYREKLQEVKRGIMQDLLTGEVRVKTFDDQKDTNNRK